MKTHVVGTLDECPHCHTEHVDVILEDVGIGSYEFWGAKYVDTQMVTSCRECGEEVYFDYEEDYPDETPEYD